MPNTQKDANVLVEPNNTWLKSSLVWTMIGLTASLTMGGTLMYSKFDTALNTLRGDIVEMADSLREIRDELRQSRLDSVAVRQATTWIELARTANKSKFPELIWPDLPR